MTTNLNIHARNAIERVTTSTRRTLVDYGRGEAPASAVVSATKGLRAQSRATRKIAPREADAILGTAALVGILVSASERAREANDINLSDDRVREAFRALDTLCTTLEIRS